MESTLEIIGLGCVTFFFFRDIIRIIGVQARELWKIDGIRVDEVFSNGGSADEVVV